MAANLPVFTDEDRNRAKNKKACDKVIPFVYETVIAWGCKKRNDETYLEYYNRRIEESWNDNKKKWEDEINKDLEKLTKNWTHEKKEEKEKHFKNLKNKKLKQELIIEDWTQEDVKHLQRDTCKGLDATLLHKLVPTICEGICRYDQKSHSSTKIESYLREVKNKRNDICHYPEAAAISETILDEIKVSAINVFNAAGDLYASDLDKQTVQDKIDELTKMLQKIENEVMTDKLQRIVQTAEKLKVDGMDEMKKAVREQATDYLPYSDDKFTRTDIYHDVRVSMSVENENEDAKLPEDENIDVFKSTEILQRNDGDIILCEGEPGSGKTTLLRRLKEDYFETGKKMFTGLDKFNLLLYMDCRDDALKNIIQLLKRLFPKTMNQLKEEDAFEALHELKLLICVDGLDELNPSSRKLLDELIRTFPSHEHATFVCTSRPGKSDSLRSSKYKTMNLQPITQEKEQIKFLKRYQANIRGIVAPKLIQAFKSVVQSCKDCLSQPIYLALFCYLFRKFGEGVCLWKNELSIMEHILKLSELTMIDRMRTTNLVEHKKRADNVTKAITQLSVQLVYRGEVTIDKNNYTELRRKIFGKAKVPHYSIMSFYFTRHADGQSFNFYHKSYLEFLAAKQLYKSFVSNKSASIIPVIMFQGRNLTNMSVGVNPAPDVATAPDDTHGEEDSVGREATAPAPDATGGEEVSVKRFDNVLRFLSMMLVDGGPRMEGALKRFLKEVCPALAKEQVPFRFWVTLTLSCLDSNHVAEAAAEAAKTVSEMETSPDQRKWQITTTRDMSAVSRMLPYHQPAWLDIRPLRSEGLPSELKPLLEAVAQWHTGQLDLFLEDSFWHFYGIDDLVICLKSARCTIRQFMGCIGPSRKAGQALAAAASRAMGAGVLPELAVALTQPRQHRLDGLEGTRHGLGVLARLNPREGDMGKRRPLPQSSVRPPLLRVNCKRVPSAAVTEAASLIEDLAPKDKHYYNLSLQQWQGTDAELQELLQRLSASEVCTEESGSPQWSPSCIFKDGRCDLCLSIHQEGWGRCVALMVPERDPRDAVQVTRVVTDETMREYVEKLPVQTLSWLDVTTKRSEAPPNALGPLMEAVAKWHHGNLDLHFYHSYIPFVACDEFLDHLHSARCPLVRFFGCLSGSSENAWRALVNGLKRAEQAGLKQLVCISLLDPRQHKLGELNGTRQSLDIRVRLPSGPAGRHRRPLPTSSLRPLWLTVEFLPSTGSNDSDDEDKTAELAAGLVEDLVPQDMRYHGVGFQHYPGTDGALDDVVERLSASGVKTTGTTPSWTEAGKDTHGNCGTCKLSSHRQGERCVRLLLP